MSLQRISLSFSFDESLIKQKEREKIFLEKHFILFEYVFVYEFQWRIYCVANLWRRVTSFWHLQQLTTFEISLIDFFSPPQIMQHSWIRLCELVIFDMCYLWIAENSIFKQRCYCMFKGSADTEVMLNSRRRVKMMQMYFTII